MATTVPAVKPVTLWLDPLGYNLQGDRLFDPANTPRSGERILEPYVHVRERLAELGVAVHTGDLLVRGELPPSPLNLYATMGMTTRFRRLARRPDTILSAFFVNECPIVEPRLFAALPDASSCFRRMYSFAPDDAMAEFLTHPVQFQPFRYPYPFSDVQPEAWARRDRKFMAIVNGNKVPRLTVRELYTERMVAVEYFSRFGEIDLYGVGWDGPPYRVGETRVPKTLRRIAYLAERRWDHMRPERDPLLAAARRVYRGPIDSKSAMLSGYTFSLCFENMEMDGWVTEKIFDCLRAGAVPIYRGAPDVERWVDPACFVDATQFSSYDELRAFLHQLSPAELDAYREAGREYFASERFRPFSKEAFADIVCGIVADDMAAAAVAA